MSDSARGKAGRTRIVIVGGGFAGAYCAQALSKKLKKLNAELWLLDRNNYFVFTPLVVEAGTGSLEPRHTVVPIRDFLRRRAEFRMADVIGVDTSSQEVSYKLIGSDQVRGLSYDHLVLAPGSVTRMPDDVPGGREHCFQLKSMADAVHLRDRAIRMMELANATEDVELKREILRCVVVGANFTGTEVAGEFEHFYRRGTKLYSQLSPDDCDMMLIELGKRILAPLGESLSDFATRHLRKRGVDVRLKTTITSVHPDHVVLSSGEVVRTRTVIWCAGIAPSPLVDRLSVPRDERGYILCNSDLRVQGFDNIWAIGDAAVNVDARGAPYPATAQHAVRQGVHLARNLGAVLRGRSATPCNLTSQGSLAALGCRTGVANVFGVKLAGFAAWWLWRSVYLMKMPGIGRKARVALDWSIGLLFRHDYVQLGVHRRSNEDGS